MRSFIAGVLTPFFAAIAIAVAFRPKHGADHFRSTAVLALLAIVIPAICANIAVRHAHTRRPRRCLHAGAPWSPITPLLGFIGGLAAITFTCILIALFNLILPWYGPIPPEQLFGSTRLSSLVDALNRIAHLLVEPAAAAIASYAAIFATAMLLPARVAGSCVHCGYDIRFSLDHGRCPECGTPIVPA